jgi:hypothetical protein
MIKAMYERSTISIRITRDGDLAPGFDQKRGIRQGFSLSPCLFILAMDFCLRVFQDSCKELGLPSHDQTWMAYADDIADKSMEEEEASIALQELEAASAFVGLRLDIHTYIHTMPLVPLSAQWGVGTMKVGHLSKHRPALRSLLQLVEIQSHRLAIIVYTFCPNGFLLLQCSPYCDLGGVLIRSSECMSDPP